MKIFSFLSMRLLTCVALIAMAVPCAAQSPTLLDDVLEPILEEEGVPAIAAAVVRGDRVIAYGAVGVQVAGTDDKVNFFNRWHVGSCTKAMTATMMAHLISDGFFTWDTTIIEVLPDLKGKIDPACEDITVRQLLTHTAGMPAYKSPNAEERALLNSLTGTPQEQRRQFLEKVLASPPIHAPGTKFEYSNAGYGIVAVLAEERMERPWERLIYMRMGVVVAMSSAGQGWPRSEDRPFEPMGHWRRDGECVPHDPAGDYQISPAIAPAGDLYCTITELARFTSVHLQGLRGIGQKWLPPKIIHELHRPELENYSCGWVRRELGGRTVEWHNGSAGTFFTWMTIDAERDIAVVVATNCGDSEHACEVATMRLLDRFAPMPVEAAPQEP